MDTEESIEQRSAPYFSNVSKRQVIFTIATLITEIGCNFCIDIPASLEIELTKYYDLTSRQFSLFYSMYYLPTIFTNTIGGHLIDRCLGIKWTTTIFSAISTLGISIFATGGAYQTFWAMLLGRFIFGLGNEIATGVCVNYCMFTWYKNIMNLVASLNSNVSFLGTLAVFQISPRLLQWLSNTTHFSQTGDLGIVIIITSQMIIPTVMAVIWMTFLGPREDQEISLNVQTHSDTGHLRFHKLSPLFWMLCLFLGLQSSLSIFSQFSQGFFTENQDMTMEEASNAVTVLNLTKSLLSVPFSVLVDRIGRNTYFVMASAVTSLVPFMFLYFNCAPYTAMVILGLSQSLLGSAFWPMIGYTVDDHRLIGSCYGIACSISAFSMFVTPFIIGILIDFYSFKAALQFFIIISTVGIGFVLIIWVLDNKSRSVLSMTPEERESINTRDVSERTPLLQPAAPT